MESVLYVGSVESRSLDEAETILLTEELRLLGRDGTKMPQIALVSDEHDDNVGIGVVSQFLEPSGDVDVGRVLGDVVDEKCSDRSSIVAASLQRREQRIGSRRVMRLTQR